MLYKSQERYGTHDKWNFLADGLKYRSLGWNYYETLKHERIWWISSFNRINRNIKWTFHFEYENHMFPNSLFIHYYDSVGQSFNVKGKQFLFIRMLLSWVDRILNSERRKWGKIWFNPQQVTPIRIQIGVEEHGILLKVN